MTSDQPAATEPAEVVEKLNSEIRRGALVLAVLSQLHTEHYGYSLRKTLADNGLDVEEVPLRPLVKVHPETGQPTLAVGRHAYGIPGLSASASESLLASLIDFATGEAERVYQHRWNEGDVVVWDNRCLMHRACPWDYNEPRIMLHSRIAGDPRTEMASSLRADPSSAED